MASVNAYFTLQEFKDRLWPSGTTDALSDEMLDQVATAVSRFIDYYCHRRFYAASETRLYTRRDGRVVFVDDLLSVTTLKIDSDGDRTYETTWATTDYDLEPYNATLMGEPYTHITTAPNSRYTFPNIRQGIQIVGSFGYASTTPPMIKEACLLQAVRIYLRKDAPFGVTGSAGMGQLMVIPMLDPDVELMLRSFRKVLI